MTAQPAMAADMMDNQMDDTEIKPFQDRNLALEVVRVTEAAALAASRLMDGAMKKPPIRPQSMPCAKR